MTSEHRYNIDMMRAPGGGQVYGAWCSCGWIGGERWRESVAHLDGQDHTAERAGRLTARERLELEAAGCVAAAAELLEADPSSARARLLIRSAGVLRERARS